MTTRLLAVVLAVVMGTTACSTFSKPKPPPTVTLDKESLQRGLRSLDVTFGQIFSVVEKDCATLQRLRPGKYPLVSTQCPTLREIKTRWDDAVTEITARIAGATEGQTIDLEKLLTFLVELAALAAKLAVLA